LTVTPSAGANAVTPLPVFEWAGTTYLDGVQYYRLTVDTPVNSGDGPFTYTVEIACPDEESEEEEPGSGPRIPFDYQLPVLPAALPDTL
jgi:hypothetical protein